MDREIKQYHKAVAKLNVAAHQFLEISEEVSRSRTTALQALAPQSRYNKAVAKLKAQRDEVYRAVGTLLAEYPRLRGRL